MCTQQGGFVLPHKTSGSRFCVVLRHFVGEHLFGVGYCCDACDGPYRGWLKEQFKRSATEVLFVNQFPFMVGGHFGNNGSSTQPIGHLHDSARLALLWRTKYYYRSTETFQRSCRNGLGQEA